MSVLKVIRPLHNGPEEVLPCVTSPVTSLAEDGESSVEGSWSSERVQKQRARGLRSLDETPSACNSDWCCSLAPRSSKQGMEQ